MAGVPGGAASGVVGGMALGAKPLLLPGKDHDPAASQAAHAAFGRCHKKAANAASDVPGSSVAEVKAENHSAASREKSDIINGVAG